MIAFLRKAATHPLLASGISWLFALAFTRMDRLLPVRVLKRTQHCLALAHPQPAYPFHLLIVPRDHIRTLLDVSGEKQIFLNEMIKMAAELMAERGVFDGGYRLVINGGAYQDIPILHMHLIAESCAG